ncbi:hypothetical protein HY091_02740 [Candidatus Kaiserbacteria bacterium]|nr:hypothetical protein [Candidatus Kaiserbacteria bacterium]
MPPQTTSVPRFSFERAIQWALVATLIAAAIVFIPSTSIPFAATKLFVIAGGAIITLALYVLARLSRGNIILPPIVLVGALWLPVAAYALSTAFSGVSFASAFWGNGAEADTLGFVLALAVLGTLAALTLRRSEQYQFFFTVLGYAIGFVALVELVFLVVGQFAPGTLSPSFSVVGTYTDFATLLGLGIISTLLTLRFLEVNTRARTLLLILGGVSLAFLAVANSSLVWTLVALVALGLFVEAVMRRNPAGGERDLENAALLEETPVSGEGRGERSLAAPLVVLAVSLFFLIGGTLGGALANALHVNVFSVRPSWQATLTVGRQVYAHSPLFGSGPDSFGGQWLKYRDSALNASVFWNLDFTSGIGFIPTSFVTTGLLGALAWLAFLGLFLFVGGRALIFRSSQDPFQRFVAVLSFLASIYLFAIALFASPGLVVLVLAFVFAGLFASTLRHTSGSGQWGVVFAHAPRAGFVIVFGFTLLLLGAIATAYSLTERYLAQINLTRATAALNSGKLDAAESATQASLAFAPSAAAYQVEAQVAQLRLGQIAASTTLAPTDAAKKFQAALSSGVNAALTATRLDASGYQSWIILGNLYTSVVPLRVQGAYENAQIAYQKAAVLNPTAPSIPYLEAQLEIAKGNDKAATDALKQAISLKQDYTQAILLLSQLEVRDGNVKDALAAAEAAAYFTPTDANVLFQVGILRAANNDASGATQALIAAVSANAQFANARYFLAALYAKKGDYANALGQLQAAAALSDANAKALAPQIASLEANKNPFSANLFAAPSAPVSP